MKTAKLFKHGGSQAVRLPKAFRFEGSEVWVERRGDEVVLRRKLAPRLRTLGDVASHLSTFAADFPDREQPKREPPRDLTW